MSSWAVKMLFSPVVLVWCFLIGTDGKRNDFSHLCLVWSFSSIHWHRPVKKLCKSLPHMWTFHYLHSNERSIIQWTGTFIKTLHFFQDTFMWKIHEHMQRMTNNSVVCQFIEVNKWNLIYNVFSEEYGLPSTWTLWNVIAFHFYIPSAEESGNWNPFLWTMDSWGSNWGILGVLKMAKLRITGCKLSKMF